MPNMTTAPGATWSASCRSSEHLARAAAFGASFVTVPPPGVADAAGIDWNAFGALIGRSSVPVFASGGVAPEHLDLALNAGAHGVALPLTAW
jgi:8-oxo-dGTP diphosphatase